MYDMLASRHSRPMLDLEAFPPLDLCPFGLRQGLRSSYCNRNKRRLNDPVAHIISESAPRMARDVFTI
jgi:hypothetical protein